MQIAFCISVYVHYVRHIMLVQHFQSQARRDGSLVTVPSVNLYEPVLPDGHSRHCLNSQVFWQECLILVIEMPESVRVPFPLLCLFCQMAYLHYGFHCLLHRIFPRHSLHSFVSLVASRSVVCVVRGFNECSLCRSWLHGVWFVSFVASWGFTRAIGIL